MMKSKMSTAVVTAVLLASVALFACGSETQEPMQPEPAPTAQPAPTSVPVPTVQRAIPNTPSPAELPSPVSTRAPVQTPTPAVVDTPVPVSRPAATPAPAPEPTSTPEPVSESSDTSDGGMTADLPPECLIDGTLTDADLIISCADEAMKHIRSVEVNVRLDLGALFMGLAPPGAEPIPAIEMKVMRVFPDDFSAVMKVPESGEISVILIEGAAYVNDPMSDVWIKFTEIPADMSEMLRTADTFQEQFLGTDSGPIEWNDVALSDDGSKYMLSFEPQVSNSGQSLFGPSDIASEVHVALSAETFLYESLALVLLDEEGTGPKVFDIQYSRHNEPITIEVPSDYIEAGSMLPGGGMVGPDPAGTSNVVGLARNADGDVELMFSAPVSVSGEVSLYVIDPATGGWELPMLSGSGTDTLTFDAEPEGKPSLIPGESVIPGLIFKSAESEVLDSDGNPVNPIFEAWTYPK